MIERGFELIEKDSQNIFDDVVYELSLLSACEFTYKNILRKLRLKKRDTINAVINQLLGQGYLTEKRPYIRRDEGFGSYHVIYSLIDPGIINYFWQRDKLTNEDKGAFIESYVSARIENILTNGHKRHKIDYYKPYRIGTEMGQDKLRFEDGEIDFVVSFGKGPSTAVEVKYGEHIKASDVPLLGKSQKEGLFLHGIVLSKGVPRIEGNLLFWPFWLL